MRNDRSTTPAQANPGSPNDGPTQIAEYVCGLLKPDEHAQVHLLLSRDDQALTQALAWQETLLALVDALPRVQPAPALRERLQRTLGIDPPSVSQPPPQLLRRPSVEPGKIPQAAPPAGIATTAHGSPARNAATTTAAAARTADPTERSLSAAPRPTAATVSAAATVTSPEPQRAPPTPAQTPVPASTSAPTPPAANRRPAPAAEDTGRPRRLMRKLWFWRLIGVCSAVAAVAGFVMPGEPPPPPVQIVKVAPTRAAILQAPGSTSTPGWTATLGPDGNLTMKPLVHTEVPAGSQTLLWTRSEKIPEPRLLGRIDPNRPVQVPAAQLGALADDQLLEITLETDADAAAALPNGPVLFIGQMAVFGAEGAPGPATAETAGASATGGPITR